MSDRMTERYQTLRGEYEAGQKMLEELDAKRAQVIQTMTRIEGAMMVLKELIDAESAPEGPASSAANSP